MYHRRYRVQLAQPDTTPEALMKGLSADPNTAAPTEFARFHKQKGRAAEMNVGDEFLVHMPGPWDGPVVVVDVTSTSFRLATLPGHLEAGQIEFRTRQEDNNLVVEIESWARSGDWLSHVMFDKLRMAKEIQLHMWTSMLERIAALAGGHRGSISIETRWLSLDV